MYSIVSSANSESLSSFFFPICTSFISFSSLMVVAKTSKTMLNNGGEHSHPCLLSGFKGNSFSFIPLRIRFAVDLSYMAFIMLEFLSQMCVEVCQRISLHLLRQLCGVYLLIH